MYVQQNNKINACIGIKSMSLWNAAITLFLQWNITGMQRYWRMKNVSHGAPHKYDMLQTQKSSFGGVSVITWQTRCAPFSRLFIIIEVFTLYGLLPNF